MDVFPVNFTKPVRVDFFGDEIEDIRVFDPTSQRTLESITEVRISSIRQDESSEREGEVFRHVGGQYSGFFPNLKMQYMATRLLSMKLTIRQRQKQISLYLGSELMLPETFFSVQRN